LGLDIFSFFFFEEGYYFQGNKASRGESKNQFWRDGREIGIEITVTFGADIYAYRLLKKNP